MTQSYSLKLFLLFFLLRTLTFQPCDGFQSAMLGQRRLSQRPTTSLARPRLVLSMSNEENKSEGDAQVDFPEDASKKEKKQVPKVVQTVVWGIYRVWSYTFTFLGVALSGGLVLNVLGYGYNFTKEDGLRIDTLEQLRTENQFQNAAKQYEREGEQRPPSSLPR
jgi:hypothetical protein